MTIAEMREKAGRALNAATAIRDELKNHEGAWPSEKQAAFDAAMADFTKAHTEAERMEQQARQVAELRAMEEFYRQPTQPTPQPQAIVHPEQRQKVIREAFGLYIRQGEQAVYSFASRQNVVAPKEIHALLSTDDTLGGFLVPDDFKAEVLKALAGRAAIRPLCRVIQTNRDTVVYPRVVRNTSDSRYPSGFAGTWQQQGYVTGGTAPTVQNQPTWAQERIPVHDWQPNAIEISPQLLEDSAVPVESIIAGLIADTLAHDEDDAFLSGNGVGRPEGILSAGCTTVNTGGASDITYAGLIDLLMNVPAQYRQNGTFLMKSTTYGNLLKLNTGTGGVYVVNPTQTPAQLWGRPIAFHEGMDACTTGSNKPIVFGDWSNYLIVERQGLRVQRLVERFAPNVGFLPVARIGGQCVNTDAFRVANVSA